MLLCHSCYIYGTWKSKDGGGLKSSYRGKLEGKGNHEVKGGGHVLLEVDLSAIYQNYLPISVSFGVKTAQ